MILLVWDVDGTLVDVSGAGKRARLHAISDFARFQDVGISDLVYETGGESDRVIMERALRVVGGKPVSDWPLVKDRYLSYLEQELTQNKGRTLPGVNELLTHIGTYPGFRQVLGTGNVEQGAHKKLLRHGLAKYFQTGGFGDVHRSRPAILKEAIANAKSLYQARFSDILIIGDTPKDASSADALRLPCLLVATGQYSASELKALGKPVVESFNNLSATMRSIENALSLFPTDR